MQVLTWVVTGLLAGWMIRIGSRSGRGFGALGDLVTGTTGAMIGGWLFRGLGVIAPDSFAGHVIVALFGAGALHGALGLLPRVWLPTGSGPHAAAGPPSGDLEAQISRLAERERRVLASVLGRRPLSHDPNQTFDAQLTFGERVADRVAAFGGSWAFIGLFLTAMMIWMALNEEIGQPFDPYPFILLNLVLSCVAALQAPVIMMSQNRQSAKDRLDARSDYEVNLRAEMEIMALHEKLDAARDRDWKTLEHLLAAHDDRLARLEQVLGAREDGPTK